MHPTGHKGLNPAFGAISEAELIAKKYHLGHFFTRKLRIDAARMHRLDKEEIEALDNIAEIYSTASKAVKALGAHANLTELLKIPSFDPLPNRVTANAIEYLCYRENCKLVKLDNSLRPNLKLQ